MDMENDKQAFLNLVIQKVDSNNIQDFMRAWLRQECKDFKLVFIQKEHISREEKQAIRYACRFANAIGYGDLVVAVSENEVFPEAKIIRILKDTSVLPQDKMEVLRMKSKANNQKTNQSASENNEAKQEAKLDTKQVNKTEKQAKLQMQKPFALLAKNPQKNSSSTKEEKKQVETIVQKITLTKVKESIPQVQKKLQTVELIQEKNDNKNEIAKEASPRIVCYTCITGEYDVLKPLSYQNQSIDFICFTDNKNINSYGWILKDIPNDLHHLSKVKQQRVLKIHPQKYLSEYDVSLWVDGNFTINCDIKKDFLTKFDLSKFSLYTNKHPLRDCIYDEEIECIKRKKDILQNTHLQIERYKQEKMPSHIGLVETGLILRNHRDPKCEEVMKLWESEVLKGSHRDQLSFNYACWKLGFKYGYLYLNAEYRQFKPTNWFNLLKHNEIIKQPLADKNKVGIVIINYNTNALVNALIKSIKKNVKSINYDIIVFNNSTNEKFICPKDVKLIDNSKNSFINFTKIIEETSCVPSSNNYASYKHAITVQFLLDILQYNDLLFLDSDTLLKRDIDFIDQRFVVIADYPDEKVKPRFIPYIMYLNQSKIKSKNIKYLDVYRMHGGVNARNSCMYDTGCSFYEDVVNAKLPTKKINYSKYIVHFGGGSWKKSKHDQYKFLNENSNLFKG